MKTEARASAPSGPPDAPAGVSASGGAAEGSPIDGIDGWMRLLADQPMPACTVDLDALHHNRLQLEQQLGSSSARLRISTAALRSTGLLRYLLTTPRHRLQGLLCSSVCEADVLIELGFDDILVSTPACRPAEAQRAARLVAQGAALVLTVDSLDHLQLLAAAGLAAEVEIPVCLDLDASWQPAAEVWFGTRRSPLRAVEEARALAAQARELGGLKVVGVSAWAAQLATPRSSGLGGWLAAPFRGMMRARSIELSSSRRSATAAALKADGHAISMVVGGSSASVGATAADSSVTDIPVGEGLLCPVRCDGLGAELKPALHFALPVVRRPDADHVTCRGGGYVSAGAVAGLPVVVEPRGLQPTAQDGWAQTQTPLRITRGEGVPLGAPVVCRPHRSAAVLERFNDVVIHRGDAVVEVVPTYRALGLSTG